MSVLSPQQASVVLNGAGYGAIRLAPAGAAWDITRLSVKVSTNTLEAICRVYNGQIGQLYVIDTTFIGSSGSTTDTVYHLEDGQAIYVEWTGGDAGATATVNFSGVQSTPEGGFRAV